MGQIDVLKIDNFSVSALGAFLIYELNDPNVTEWKGKVYIKMKTIMLYFYSQ